MLHLCSNPPSSQRLASPTASAASSTNYAELPPPGPVGIGFSHPLSCWSGPISAGLPPGSTDWPPCFRPDPSRRDPLGPAPPPAPKNRRHGGCPVTSVGSSRSRRRPRDTAATSDTCSPTPGWRPFWKPPLRRAAFSVRCVTCSASDPAPTSRRPCSPLDKHLRRRRPRPRRPRRPPPRQPCPGPDPAPHDPGRCSSSTNRAEAWSRRSPLP